MKPRRPLRILKIVLIALLAVSGFSFVVMWLWNHLMPGLFGLHTVGFWQALGLLVLSKILFGGFRGRPGFATDWRMRLIRRWEDMTAEEWEKFRAGMRGGCDPRQSAPAEPKP